MVSWVVSSVGSGCAARRHGLFAMYDSRVSADMQGFCGQQCACEVLAVLAPPSTSSCYGIHLSTTRLARPSYVHVLQRGTLLAQPSARTAAAAAAAVCKDRGRCPC